MKTDPLILTFDCGTQSLRALLVDARGNIVAKEQIHFPPFYSLEPGFFEIKPVVYLDTLAEASKKIHMNYPTLIDRIIGVTITTFRDTCLCVDENIEPLRDVIVWVDERQAKCEEPLPLLSRFLFRLVGMSEAIQDQRKISKSNWLKENEPEMWKKTYKYIVLSSYLNYQLIGKLLDSSASQVAHIPFDFKKSEWYKPSNLKFDVFGVEQSKLQDLVHPGEILGLITKEASEKYHIKEGLPVIATASDKACETLGSGVLTNNLASLSFGTAATIQISLNKYVEPEQFMPAYPGAVKCTFNSEVQIYRGYWMINWFKKEFAENEVKQAEILNVSPEKLLNKELKKVPPGCNGLILQPYWAPLLKQPEAKGSIIGYSAEHTRAHTYRAIIEGIGYALLEGLENIEKNSRQKIKGLTVSGGGSQSDEICQITADMFNKPVYRIQTYEACGLGSSIIAFVTLGVFENYEQAIEKMVHYKDTFYPQVENHEIYKHYYSKVYKKLYKQLQPLYKNLREINNSINSKK